MAEQSLLAAGDMMPNCGTWGYPIFLSHLVLKGGTSPNYQTCLVFFMFFVVYSDGLGILWFFEAKLVFDVVRRWVQLILQLRDGNLQESLLPTAWWFGCHQFYVLIQVGIGGNVIIPIDELHHFSGVAQPPGLLLVVSLKPIQCCFRTHCFFYQLIGHLMLC